MRRGKLILAAAIGLCLGGSIVTPATAAETTAEQATVSSISVQAEDSSLDITLDKPVTPTTAASLQSQLQAELGPDAPKVQPQKIDPGPTYPVVHCSAPDNTFSDRNGTFHTRYNCKYNNVNWGYKVALPLQAIAAGPMNEAGMRWYKGTGHYLGANAPHTVGVSYLLHGTQGGMASGDLLSWWDTLTFPVEVAGNPGKAVLHIGGNFVVLR